MSSPPPLERRLAAFWFADIAGFTPLSARDERAALEAVDKLRRGAREEVEKVGGRLVKLSGDSVLAEFPSSDAALRSAIALRDALADSVPLHFGVHLGEVSTNQGDIYGDGVNTAARLQARAETGQILASEDVYRHVRSNPAFRFHRVGELRLKGLDTPVIAYAAELAGSNAPVPDASARGEAAETRRGSEPAQPAAPKATRLIVAPFRLLKPDDETAFLAYSLADAVSFSLSNLQSIVVRSSNLTGGGSAAPVDPREVARQTDVDLVVSGTLLRVGDRVQITAELSDGRDGTRLGSFRSQAGMGDLFELQEEMTERIVESLALPLSARERLLLGHDVPANPRAYELYLRANELSYRLSDWYTPRDLYLAALGEDPTYAPAWSQLGRCHRLIAKYGPKEVREYNFAQAEKALKKAIELNPDLDQAHGFAAQLETDLGRCGEAMLRLVERLATRPQGVDLLGSLVQALRYCGLLEESLQADAEARAIDPSTRTSVAYTHFMIGDFEAAVSAGTESDLFVNALASVALGRHDKARELIHEMLDGVNPLLKPYIEPARLTVEGEVEQAIAVGRPVYKDFPDPEGRFFFARDLALGGHGDEALDMIESLAPSYCALPASGRDPWLGSIDCTERYLRVLKEVEERRDVYREQYRSARGEVERSG